MNYIRLDRQRPHNLLQSRLFSVFQSWVAQSPSSTYYDIIFLGMVNDSLVFYLTRLDVRVVITFYPHSFIIMGGSTFNTNLTDRAFG